jgi:hypothetical protein
VLLGAASGVLAEAAAVFVEAGSIESAVASASPVVLLFLSVNFEMHRSDSCRRTLSAVATSGAGASGLEN